MIIVSINSFSSQEDVKEFMRNYWVPEAYEFNIDTQLYEVALRPFDKMKD